MKNDPKPGLGRHPQPAGAGWLNRRRSRVQAVILALCLWGVCAVDFATPGLIDRAGNIKFQDFLQFYISARLISQHRADQLYDECVAAAEMQRLIRQDSVQQPTRVRLPTVYGPQVGLFFVPLTRFSFLTAAIIWVGFSVVVFSLCFYLLWKFCPSLRIYRGLVALVAIAFPPLFHFFVRGQISMMLLVCFTVAFLAFRSEHDWLAGIALGLLVFKPQFLAAIPLILLASQAWKAFAGLVIGAVAELAFTWMYFGSAIMRAYLDMLWHVSRWIGTAEPGAAHVQMHSLRSFWLLLLPWPGASLVLYVLSSFAIVGIAAASWKSSGPLALRFSALIFAAVLVNPHLFVYDLLVLIPALLLLADWTLHDPSHPSTTPLSWLLYLTFILPLLGPLALWTHLQLSVPAFVALQWTLWSILRRPDPRENMPTLAPAL